MDRRSAAAQKPLLIVDRVSKLYPAVSGANVLALNDVSLKLNPGETLAIVGESGCGKTTLGRILLQLESPTRGSVRLKGRDISTLKGEELRQCRRHIQAVFQDATSSFNPKMKVKEIICAPLLNYKLIKKSEVDAAARRLLRDVELPEHYIDLYPFRLSGGERQRVGIARALALEPDIIVCDEATSALDVIIQKKICDMLKKLQREKGVSIVFICHDLALAASISHRMAVMYSGMIMELISGGNLALDAAHPYTKLLVDSVFSIHMDFSKQIPFAKEAPVKNTEDATGCPFCSRCSQRKPLCSLKRPELKSLGQGHKAACHLL